MSLESISFSKSLKPYILSQIDNLPPNPVIDAQPLQEVGKKPNVYKTPEIDLGIAHALNEIERSFETQVRQEIPYAQRLLPFFRLSESESVQTLDEMPLNFLQILLTPQDSEERPLLDVFEFAALKGYFLLLRKLFQRREELVIPPAEDGSGWNIAHFAALHPQGTDALQTIPELQSQLDHPNCSGATPQDLLFWLSWPSSVSVKLFGPDHPPVTPEDFFTFTGNYYWDRPRFRPATLLYLALASPKIPKSLPYLSHLLGPKVDSYIQTLDNQPCKLYIKKMQGPQVPEPLKGQWECRASQDIAPGEIIALYSGEVFAGIWDPVNSKHTKTLSVAPNLFIDGGFQGGSLAEMINHGFPNCAFFPHQYRGIPVIAIVALESLKAGDRLFLSYGTRYFDKFGIDYLNLNQNGIDAFLTNTQELQHTFFHIAEDGKVLYYSDNGAPREIPFQTGVPEPQAIKGWAGYLRLEYLAQFHYQEMAVHLNKLKNPWLKEKVFNKLSK